MPFIIKSDHSAQDNPSGTSVRPRWWLLGLIVTGAILGWANIWLRPSDLATQAKNIETAKVILAFLGASLVWLMVFSRIRWKIRWSILAGLLGGVGVMAGLFRIQGVTGDLVPVLEWRWKKSLSSPEGGIVKGENREATLEESTLIGRPSQTFEGFMGPTRNGEITGLEISLGEGGLEPELVWRRPLGEAWSGFVVWDRWAVTQEQREGKEWVVAYELTTGEVLWAHSDDTTFESTIAGNGPRATPSVSYPWVYTLGASGRLNALDLRSGQLRWTKDILLENDAPTLDWGVTGSPLVVDGKVIVSAGGKEDRSLVAYDAETGEMVWAGGSDPASYSSPFLAEVEGDQQIWMFNGNGLTGHLLETGEVLWHTGWKGGHPHVALPLALPGNQVFISSGYGTGCGLFQVKRLESEVDGATGGGSKFSVEPLWKNGFLKAKFANMVHRDGFVYGLDDGILVCLDLSTQKRAWKEGRLGHGQMLLVEDVLWVMAESGEVVWVAADPSGYRELGRFRALEGKTWNPLAVTRDYLLVRNHQEAACYRFRGEKM